MNSVEEEEEELKFECVVCQRKFKSGKALGGHKRMHNMSKKLKKTLSEVSDNNNVSDQSSSDCDDDRCCRLCGKGFPSEKSLFGHMRSHPERGWRGIDPPEDRPLPPVFDLTWSLTGPRGGASKILGHHPSDYYYYSSVLVPGMDRASRDAVLDLMMLKATKNSTTIFKYLLEEEEEEVGRRAKKTKTKKDYICTVCNKSFTSYQALGGHRSSHNKNNNNNNNNNNNVFYDFDLNQSPPPDHHA